MNWIEDLMAEHTGEDGAFNLEAFKKALKAEYAEQVVSKADYEAMAAELKTANKTIKALKDGNEDNADLQDKVSAYEAQVEKLQSELAKSRLDFAVDKALLGAKARNAKAVRALLKMNELKLLEDGSVKGLEAQIKELTEGADSAFLFEQKAEASKQKKPVYVPKAGSNPKESFGSVIAELRNESEKESAATGLWDAE